MHDYTRMILHNAVNHWIDRMCWAFKNSCVEDAASFLKKHREWREEADAFISPDGQRFVKSMGANNLRVLLLDMQAHIGKKLPQPMAEPCCYCCGGWKKQCTRAKNGLVASHPLTVLRRLAPKHLPSYVQEACHAAEFMFLQTHQTSRKSYTKARQPNSKV